METPSLDCKSGSTGRSITDAATASTSDDTKLSNEIANLTSTGVDETSSLLQRVEFGSDAKPKACARPSLTASDDIEFAS